MTTSKWTIEGSVETVLDITALNGLVDEGNKITSTPLSNDDASERDLYANFQIYIAAQGSARDTGAHIQLYILSEIEDNYAWGGDSLDPAVNNLKDSFELDAATTARYASIDGILLPPANFHVLIINKTGQTFASGTILKMVRYGVEAV